MLSAPTRYSDGNRSVSVRQNMKLAIRRFGGREDNSAGQTNIQCARAVERIRRTARPPAYSTIRAAGQGQGCGVCVQSLDTNIARRARARVPPRRDDGSGRAVAVPLGAGAGCCWAGRRSEPNAALRLGRYDAMRCAAVVSARPRPRAADRRANGRPPPITHVRASVAVAVAILSSRLTLNARARRRGAIRANPRLIDRAWPAGRRVCSRPGVCSALHSIVPTCSRCRAVHRVAPVCCVVACLFHVRGVLRTRDNRTTMDYWISRADMPARRPLSDGDEKKMLN